MVFELAYYDVEVKPVCHYASYKQNKKKYNHPTNQLTSQP